MTTSTEQQWIEGSGGLDVTPWVDAVERMTREEIQAERERLSQVTIGLAGRSVDIGQLQDLRDRRSALAFELVRRALLETPQERRIRCRRRP